MTARINTTRSGSAPLPIDAPGAIPPGRIAVPLPRHVSRTAAKVEAVAGPALGAIAQVATDVMGDIGAVYRMTDDGLIRGFHHGRPFNPTVEAHNYQTLGYATTLSLATGAAKVYDAIQQYQVSGKIGDEAGQTFAKFRVAEGVGAAIGGAGFLGGRAINSYPAIHHTTQSAASAALGGRFIQLGLAGFVLQLTSVGISCGLRAYEGLKVKQELAQVMEGAAEGEKELAVLAFLRHKLLGGTGEAEAAKYERVLGDAGLIEELKVAFHEEGGKLQLAPHVNFTLLKERVDQTLNRAIVFNGLVSALAIFANIGFVLFSCSGVGTAVALMASILCVATSIVFLIVDGVGLYQAMKSDTGGKYDKAWMFALALILTAASLLSMVAGGWVLDVVSWGTIVVTVLWFLVWKLARNAQEEGCPVIKKLVHALEEKNYNYALHLMMQLERDKLKRIAEELSQWISHFSQEEQENLSQSLQRGVKDSDPLESMVAGSEKEALGLHYLFSHPESLFTQFAVEAVLAAK